MDLLKAAQQQRVTACDVLLHLPVHMHLCSFKNVCLRQSAAAFHAVTGTVISVCELEKAHCLSQYPHNARLSTAYSMPVDIFSSIDFACTP